MTRMSECGSCHIIILSRARQVPSLDARTEALSPKRRSKRPSRAKATYSPREVGGVQGHRDGALLAEAAHLRRGGQPEGLLVPVQHDVEHVDDLADRRRGGPPAEQARRQRPPPRAAASSRPTVPVLVRLVRVLGRGCGPRPSGVGAVQTTRWFRAYRVAVA